MKFDEYLSALEAVLFSCGEPMEITKIAEALEQDLPTLEKLLTLLEERLDHPVSGIRLVKLGNFYQLCTKTEHANHVRKALDIRRNTPLSQAGFEVLAVIAYNQPVTKAFVEQVRSVDCSGVVSTLAEKGLIEEKGRLELPGRPLLYGTTPVFLRSFGLSSLDDLPPLPEKDSSEQDEQTVAELLESKINQENTGGLEDVDEMPAATFINDQ